MQACLHLTEVVESASLHSAKPSANWATNNTGILSEFGTSTPKNDSIRASTIGSKGAKRLLIHFKYSDPGAQKSIRAVSLRVGSRSQIFGIDPIPEMVAAARRAADRHGLKYNTL